MVIALVCARGGSKGLPGKNILNLCGKPLISYAIETGISCPEIDTVIVSTDDEEIAKVAREAGASVPFMRPKNLAQDSSPEWLVWQHALAFLETKKMMPEKLVILPATTPLRRVEDVSAAIKLFDSGPYDGVISITDAHRNPCFNMVAIDQHGLVNIAMPTVKTIHRRQDAPEFFDITTAFYVMKPTFVNLGSALFDGKIAGLKIPLETAIDIDSKLDFDFVEFLLSKKYKPID